MINDTTPTLLIDLVTSLGSQKFKETREVKALTTEIPVDAIALWA